MSLDRPVDLWVATKGSSNLVGFGVGWMGRVRSSDSQSEEGWVGTTMQTLTQRRARARVDGRTRSRWAAGTLAAAVVITTIGGSGLTSAAHAVTGAAFTTVNETVDGTGHCANGNPQVNCNIYDGKQYVWLSGGPVTASLGAGTYFFSVMAPGGQANPN